MKGCQIEALARLEQRSPGPILSKEVTLAGVPQPSKVEEPRLVRCEPPPPCCRCVLGGGGRLSEAWGEEGLHVEATMECFPG